MTTPILMLVLLMGPWFVSRIWSLAKNQPFNGRAAAAWGIALLFMFTGVGHFLKSKSMALMFPEFVPQKLLLVQVSGAFEVALAIALFTPAFRKFAAKIAMILLVLLFPLNIYAAINEVPLGGHAWGTIYLWIRGPVQLITLVWIYWFALRKPTSEKLNHA